MSKSKGVMKRKLYQCSRCGYQKQIDTNHYGECYSFGNYNYCPKCPPFARPTVWICMEVPPEGEKIPPAWNKHIIVQKFKTDER